MTQPPPVALPRDTLPAKGGGMEFADAVCPTSSSPLAGEGDHAQRGGGGPRREARHVVAGMIVATARAWLGTPYAHQASLKGVACDCLGLVRGVWREVYGEEPEATPAYSPDWAEAGGQEALAQAARRRLNEIAVQAFEGGDLLLFRWRPHLPAKHAAIATSLKTMVHAQEGASVCEVAITPWWRRRIAYAFRFPTPR